VLTFKGYEANNAWQTLREIAKENRAFPDKLYEAVKSKGLKPLVLNKYLSA